MKKFILTATTTTLIALILCSCIPLTRSIPRRAVFHAMNEKIFIYPVTDSSSLDRLQEWPDEKILQAQLKTAIKKFDLSMAVEFRQNEKFGLYEVVDDSIAADIRVKFVMENCQLKKDTLVLPVKMTINQAAFEKNYIIKIDAYGIYRAKSDSKSRFHYLYILLSDFCRNFPYNKAASVFFRSD